MDKQFFLTNKGIANRDFYEKSHNYLNFFSKLPLEFYKIYSDIINKHTVKKNTILDIGCGAGTATAQISTDRKTIGIDWSLKFLKMAKQHFPQRDFIQADVCKIPIADGSVDFIGAYNVLEHIYDVKGFLKEARRVLRKGAKLLIIAPNSISPFMPLLNFYYSKKYKFQKGHAKFISVPDLIRLTGRQMLNFAQELFSDRVVFRYKKIDIKEMEYTDDDIIFYSSYFLIRYFKKNGFRINNKMVAPITNTKHLFAKLFPYLFTTIYIMVEKQ